MLWAVTSPNVQDAEKYMDQSGGKAWWADHSWSAVFMGACAVMWEETGDRRCVEELSISNLIRYMFKF